MQGLSNKTYTATIWLGLTIQSAERTLASGYVAALCREFCDRRGFACSVQECEFVYTGGQEPGVRIEAVKLPRYKEHVAVWSQKVRELAEHLRLACKQARVTIVFTDETYTTGDLHAVFDRREE